jgi:hypothetical protein
MIYLTVYLRQQAETLYWFPYSTAPLQFFIIPRADTNNIFLALIF